MQNSHDVQKSDVVSLSAKDRQLQELRNQNTLLRQENSQLKVLLCENGALSTRIDDETESTEAETGRAKQKNARKKKQ